MTVTYTYEVSDCKGFGNFWRLLFRWRGSVYKLVWTDLLAYTIIYFTLSVVYRVVLEEEQRRMFEKVSLMCNYFSDFIPVSFVLGFYVSIVIRRWWDQYLILPWPDSIALYVSTSIHGHDRQGRLMRRTILRYVNLAITLTLSMITPRVKKRFPTLDHMVEAGFMTANEKKIFSTIEDKAPHPLYYVPLVWAGTLVSRARKEGRIRDDFAMKTIIDELNNLRVKLNGLIGYDWISVPLVYTQVVSLAVYTFFLSTIMGRQFLDPEQKYPKNDIDFYFPFFTMLQFFFYMGWLKVAETLINPFGEDDDDFEVNWLIDRNIQVSYLIVDEMHTEYPELTQDLYFDEVFPQELPYTVATEQYRRDPPMGSTATLQVPEAQQEFLPMLEEEPEKNEGNDDPERADAASGVRRMNSARSFGSSVSGRKNSLVSMLQNKLRRGSLGTNTGSHVSIKRRNKYYIRSASQYESHLSDTSLTPSSAVRRANTNPSLQKHIRSASQSESHLSDISIISSAAKKDTSVTSLQDSDVVHLSHESVNVDVDREGIFYLSSSPMVPRRRVTLPPLATIASSSSSSSCPPDDVFYPKDTDPILLKVSRLKVDVTKEKDQDEGASTSQSKKISPFATEEGSSSSTLISSSQVSQQHEGGQMGPEAAESESILTSTMPDQEKPNPSESNAERPINTTGLHASPLLEAAREEDPPAEEEIDQENNSSQEGSWYHETWQL